MSGLDGLTREEILRIHIEAAYQDSPSCEPMVLNEDEHASIVKGRTSLYYDRGIIPFDLDPATRVMRAGFCADIILAETEGWDEQPFLAYLVYWTLRLKVRMVKAAELYSVSPEPHDSLLEEIVEAEMVASGLNRWWESRLRGRA